MVTGILTYLLDFLRQSTKVPRKKIEVEIRANGKQERIKDPFDIPLELADKIKDEEMINLYKLIEKQRGEFLDQKFREHKAVALALSGDEVIPFHKVPSLEDTDEIEKRTGKICYVFLRPAVEEVANWGITNLELPWNDHYPTVPLYFGKSNWTDDEVFQNNQKIDADLDTGNAKVGFNAFDYNAVWSYLGQPRVSILRQGEHVGEVFYGHGCKSKIGIKAADGSKILKELDIILVINWVGSPFLKFNPSRQGFVGRELMFKFGLEVELDTLNKKTAILSFQV